MARAIYEVKLRENYFPATSVEDALEMQRNGNCCGLLQESEFIVTPRLGEESTIKLFLLAKTMYDMEKYTYQEVKAAVTALSREMGYFAEAEQFAETVTTWIERFDDMPRSEFEDWLMG
jgi:hypothetical protein